MAETTHRVGIIMNGVTGRMGTNQHLIRSLCAIRDQGGVQVAPGETIMPDPLLVGRNPAKLKALVAETGIEKWTTDVDAAIADPDYAVYFDAQTTNRRVPWVTKAIAAGKHVYCEKPTAETVEGAYALYVAARDAGVKHGVVQDKLWLPGLLKLQRLVAEGFFGRILSVRGEFGYWVYEGGEHVPLQRPSWNYRKEDGGGMIVDMLCHWRYVLDNCFGAVKSVLCHGATHIPERFDEAGKPYTCTADDAAYAIFELDGDIVAQFNSSWCTRVYRDDLLIMQVDGTEGSAIVGLRDCWVQPRAATPRAVWNPDVPNPMPTYDAWLPVPDVKTCENAFKVQWELFLRHVVKDTPFRWGLLEGAKGVQLAQKGIESWEKRAWVDLPELQA